MLTALTLCALAVSTEAMTQGYTFSAYLKEFQKTYPSQEEYEMREQIFTQNLEEMLSHNELFDNKEVSYTKGVNKFFDMTPEEFAPFRGGYKAMRMLRFETPASLKQLAAVKQLDVSDLPAEVSWLNATTPVKNQGGCGSCWAFASTETLESHHFIKTGKLSVLAPQQLVDCTPNPTNCGGSGGCEGATAELAYSYLKGTASGLTEESQYKYTAADGTCRDSEVTGVAPVTGFKKLTENSYEDVITTLALTGPIAVAVDASEWSIYGGGVYTGCPTTSNVDIDHLVQLVGYGVEEETPYWLVRNSWGEGWGEKGYIKIERHVKGDFCGKDTTPLDGSGCAGGPAEVEVCGSCGILYDTVIPQL